MRRFAILLTVVLFAGCSGGQTATTSSDTTSTTTVDPTTSTSIATVTTTSSVPVTSTTVASPPELLLDVALSSPTAPWHSVAVESAEITVSGYVDPDATVELSVTNPPDGDLVFETTAQVESNAFHGTVTLAPGRNLVAIIATGPGGGRTALNLDARYEPEATVEFGYLTRVSSSEIVADYAQWLTGDEAAQAAFEDGVIATVEEGVPNDYYIRNVNSQLRTLPPAADVAVWLISPAAQLGSRLVDPGEWLELFNDGAPWSWEDDDVPNWEDHLHFGYYGASMVDTPYWFVILDGEVIAVEQQYVP